MKGNIHTNELYDSILFSWGKVKAYYNALPSERHYQDGFRDVVTPTLNENQKLGKHYFDEENDVFTFPVVDLTPEEIEANAQAEIDAMPTLLKKYLEENGVFIEGRDIDIHPENYEIFTPEEKEYDLFGFPKSKNYYYGEQLVFKILYTKLEEDFTHENVTKTEFIGMNKTFVFYKSEDLQHYITKEINALKFKLVSTVSTDENGNFLDVAWSSSNRDKFKRSMRYNQEGVLNTFNPFLYRLFINLFGDLYVHYKNFGDNTNLHQAIINSDDVHLEGEVAPEDLRVIYGELPEYPTVKVRSLLLEALV